MFQFIENERNRGMRNIMIWDEKDGGEREGGDALGSKLSRRYVLVIDSY